MTKKIYDRISEELDYAILNHDLDSRVLHATVLNEQSVKNQNSDRLRALKQSMSEVDDRLRLLENKKEILERIYAQESERTNKKTTT